MIESKSQVEFIDITKEVEEVISQSGVREGQVLVYSPHTTAGIAVNHNETLLLQDFMRVLHKIAPIDDRYSHDIFELTRANKSDGRSNGNSHCKVLMMGISTTLPIDKGHMIITEKQSIFVVETDGARKREIVVQIMGI